MLRLLALGVNTLIFSLSALKKLQAMLTSGHPLMGAGRLYPGWLLPLALVQEVSMVVLLHVDRPIGVLGCFAFIGGIAHAQLSGPIKAPVPLAVVALATLNLAAGGAAGGGRISARLGLSHGRAGVQPGGLLLLGALACAAGAAFGAAAAAANAPLPKQA